MTPREGMRAAIEMFGSQMKLANEIYFTQTAVMLASKGRKISAEMANNVEVATEGRVTRADLRPDLFGPNLRMIKKQRTRACKRAQLLAAE